MLSTFIQFSKTGYNSFIRRHDFPEVENLATVSKIDGCEPYCSIGGTRMGLGFTQHIFTCIKMQIWEIVIVNSINHVCDNLYWIDQVEWNISRFGQFLLLCHIDIHVNFWDWAARI